ncbi:hypothetical protein K470DRAFT_279775 [Piedraia hortae CBS 480.64]|uniref:FAD-binding domain-containing protein n=1 Tax=Piedraia hortae CBS 480.64 TaxID=1314780 RepID=A0A6A7CC51_9PEZI|nr:hypothetical protein K470DRAFT_279775 [Piedraia hortae CBS 480.64]
MAEEEHVPTVETPYLIVGGGPAGASLACFLSSHGLAGIIISSADGTAKDPRVHATNPATIKCFRDIGLQEAVLQVATPEEYMSVVRFCHDMIGEEYVWVKAWSNYPATMGDYVAASPCGYVDLPQPLLESVLGWKVWFNTTFVKFERSGMAGPYVIKSKYLFGCSGASSRIVRQLDILLIRNPGQGHAIIVIVEADLSFMKHKPEDSPMWTWTTVHEWMSIIMPPSVTDSFVEMISHANEATPVKLLHISKWRINDIAAELHFVFYLGDAVHHHPPPNDLGSHTCIQDAYNLAWKVAYVEKGLADAKLLDSYSDERQPIGVGTALGIAYDGVEMRRSQFNQLKAPSEAGRKQREKLREGLDHSRHEFGAIGIDLNQRYKSSAVIHRDELAEPPHWPADDYVMRLHRSTFPGFRLPHAELFRVYQRSCGSRGVLHIDGYEGEAWKDAARGVGERLGFPFNAYSIGWIQDWKELLDDWTLLCEVDEDGCVLCRPDRTICWRSMKLRDDCVDALLSVVQSVLGLDKGYTSSQLS